MVMLMLLIPVYSAITCGVMTGLSYHDCLSREERNLKRLLMVYHLRLPVLSRTVCLVEHRLSVRIHVHVHISPSSSCYG